MLTAKISIWSGFVSFIKEVTRWLGVWMDAHPTLKEHHNQYMDKAGAAETQLWSLTVTYGVVPACVRAKPKACIQAVTLDGSMLWWDPKDGCRREDLQLRQT